MKTIGEITDKLKSMMSISDIKSTHPDADKLLLEAIKILGFNANEDTKKINELIEAYESLAKWYS